MLALAFGYSYFGIKRIVKNSWENASCLIHSSITYLWTLVEVNFNSRCLKDNIQTFNKTFVSNIKIVSVPEKANGSNR